MLKTTLKNILVRFAFEAGILKLRRSLSGRKHVIFTFHHISSGEDTGNTFDSCPTLSADSFRQILLCVDKYFDIVPLRRFTESLRSSKPLAALTFDDGWRSNFDHAFPLLRKNSIPATIFVVSNRIGSREPLWQKVTGDYFKIYRKNENKNQIAAFKAILGIDFSEPLSRGTYYKIIKNLKLERQATIEQKIDELKHLHLPKVDSRLFLSAEEIREMSKFGIDFGSHGANHVILTNETSEVVEGELLESRIKLEKILGREVDMLSYPNGNYTQAIVNIARSLGYRVGCTAERGRVVCKADIMALPRVEAEWRTLVSEKAGVDKPLLAWVMR